MTGHEHQDAADDRRLLETLRILGRSVWSSRQRRMLREAYRHVSNRPKDGG